MPATPESDREAVRRVVHKINDAWLKGHPDDMPLVLDDCFGEDITIKGPDFQEAARGKQAAIEGYVDFARRAEMRECQLAEPVIDLYGDTAIATYSWEMTYALDGREYRESGHDLFVFVRNEGLWRAVWRLLLQAAPQ